MSIFNWWVKNMQAKLAAIKSSCFLQMKVSFGRPTFRFCVFFQPILYAFLLYMMYQGKSPDNFINYVILGSGIISFWSTICFSSAGDIERERFMGTLENLFASPIGLKTVMFGKILGNTIHGIFSILISLVFIVAVFNVKISIAHPIWFALGFLLMVLSFIAISMLISSLFTLSRNSRALMNCLEYPIFILCGMAFPIDILPDWVKVISYLLSPTWGIKILRMSVSGVVGNSELLDVSLILLAITFVYFILADIMYRKIDRETRIKATLGVH